MTPSYKTHLGLYGLALALALATFWMFGARGRGLAPQPRPATQAQVPSPGALLTPDVVRRRCRTARLAPREPPPLLRRDLAPRTFPPPRPKRPRLTRASRGALDLQARLMAIRVKTRRLAPLIHRAALGLAERARFFSYLADHPGAARRWRARRARQKSKTPTPPGGSEGLTAPSRAQLTLRAQRALRQSLSLYDTLDTNPRMRRYARRPAAMLEHAALLLGLPTGAPTPPPRHASRRRAKPSMTARLLAPRRARRSPREQARVLLHRLVDDHPHSQAAITARSWLVAHLPRAGRCQRVLFLAGKKPPQVAGRVLGSAHGREWAYVALEAGRCLLARAPRRRAIPWLRAAVAWSLRATEPPPSANRIQSDRRLVAREAARLLLDALPTDPAKADVNRVLVSGPPELRQSQRAWILHRLIATQHLSLAVSLCEATRPTASPAGARPRGTQ